MLLLVVPADWGAKPEGVTELRRRLGEDHGGRQMLRMTRTPLQVPRPHSCGLWGRAELRLARPDPAHRGRLLQRDVAGAEGGGLGGGWTGDRLGWTLGKLLRPLGGEPQAWRDEVRPTDQLHFMRRAPTGFGASSGRWRLVPAHLLLEEAKQYAIFNARVESLEAQPVVRAASAGHLAHPALFHAISMAPSRLHAFVTGSPVGGAFHLSSAYFRQPQASPCPPMCPPRSRCHTPPAAIRMKPMNGLSSKQRTEGFTLLEMLLVLAVAAILMAVGGLMLSKQINDARNLDFVENLAQDINLARSVAMAKGQRTQIQFTSTSGYVVKNLDAAGQPVLSTRTNASVVMTGINVNDKLICSSSGFCLAYTSGGVMKTLSQVNCTYGAKTRVLRLTVLGLTRIES